MILIKIKAKSFIMQRLTKLHFKHQLPFISFDKNWHTVQIYGVLLITLIGILTSCPGIGRQLLQGYSPCFQQFHQPSVFLSEFPDQFVRRTLVYCGCCFNGFGSVSCLQWKKNFKTKTKSMAIERSLYI